jgi:cell division protein FtsI (penicillin-binding protein 3)
MAEEGKKTERVADEPKDLAREKRNILKRYDIVIVLLSLFICAILVFFFRIAFVDRETTLKAAERKLPDQPVKPDRGNIYSSDGKLMATSVPRYYLYMDFRADGFSTETFNAHADSLALCLSKKLKNRTPKGYKEYLLRGLKSKSRSYPLYEGRVSFADLKEIRQYPFLRKGANKSGFYAKEIAQRQKFYGSLASRTIGDIYNEMEVQGGGLPRGKNGLELQYDSLLRGSYGTRSFVRIGRNWTNVMAEEATPGMDLLTTINLQIQDFTEKALVDKLREIDAESGTAIVMEVRTGEIKAISNIERVGPGRYVETKTRNYAVADQTEPGSTFKIPAIMVALEDKVCTPDDIVDTGNGIYRYEGRNIVDHNASRGGYHRITVAEAIWHSSNIGIAKTILKGYRDNPKKFFDGLSRIGMDADLNLEIPGSGRTKIRTPNDPQWSKLTLPWTSFGYEVEVPPVQMLTFYNAIANDGKMLRPIFVREIRRNGKREHLFTAETLRRSICSRETLDIIREMMFNAVEKGTGKAVHSDAVAIAGKTGTAQIAIGGGYQSHQVSFCGYFPADNPQYSCIVVIRRPRIGAPVAGTMSGGVFKTIAEKIYASQKEIDTRTMAVDATGVRLPDVKSGQADALSHVLGELDIPSERRSGKSLYVSASRTGAGERLKLTPVPVKEGQIPNVVGMGAKDAVYAMESCGLQVNLSGRGKVVSQSVTPGQRVVKGQTVALVLNN